MDVRMGVERGRAKGVREGERSRIKRFASTFLEATGGKVRIKITVKFEYRRLCRSGRCIRTGKR